MSIIVPSRHTGIGAWVNSTVCCTAIITRLLLTVPYSAYSTKILYCLYGLQQALNARRCWTGFRGLRAMVRSIKSSMDLSPLLKFGSEMCPMCTAFWASLHDRDHTDRTGDTDSLLIVSTSHTGINSRAGNAPSKERARVTTR